MPRFSTLTALSLTLAITLAGCGTTSARPTPSRIDLPGITVDLEENDVRLAAEVCLARGQLEYVLCRPGTFEHESIFITRSIPEHLHTALLMIGATPVPMRDEHFWITAAQEPAAHIDIDVTWQDERGERQCALHELLADQAGGTVAAADWLFNGSHFITEGSGQRYAANNAGMLIAVIAQPAAVIHFGHQAGDPQQAPAQALTIRSESCPPVGTAVQLRFRLAVTTD